MPEKRKVKLKVDGVSYTFIGEEKEEDMVETAEKMNALSKELKANNPYLSHVMTMTLVAYTMTDRLKKAEIDKRNLEIFAQKYEEEKKKTILLSKQVEELKNEKQGTFFNLIQDESEMRYKEVLRLKDAEIGRLKRALSQQSKKPSPAKR